MSTENTALQVFNYSTQDLTILKRNEIPWFMAKNVADILGLQNVNHAINPLDSDEKERIPIFDLTSDVRSKGGTRKPVWFVTESGLYKIIMRSDKEEAQKFQNWVCREVLPSIRKNGAFAMRPQIVGEQAPARPLKLVFEGYKMEVIKISDTIFWLNARNLCAFLKQDSQSIHNITRFMTHFDHKLVKKFALSSYTLPAWFIHGDALLQLEVPPEMLSRIGKLIQFIMGAKQDSVFSSSQKKILAKKADPDTVTIVHDAVAQIIKGLNRDGKKELITRLIQAL